MRLFKRKNSEEIGEEIIHKQAAKRSLMFVIGAMLSALSFNLFYVPNNFVGGGIGGLAIVFNELWGLNSTLVIMAFNVIFLCIYIGVFGFKKSINIILGASVYTIFVAITENVPSLINFYFDDVLLYVLAAGLVGGFGESLVYKAGFNTGGTSILAQVIVHFTKMPLGQVLRYLAYIIILIGGFTFGYTSVMYSLIITVISTSLVDKILIGINDSKTFFIQTDKENEVTDFIITVIESGVTEFSSKGAFSHKRKTMLMCVVPTEKYSFLKSAIKEIDPDAFIVVSDCYEVLGGTKRKSLLD